jgi:hypothetical protein
VAVVVLGERMYVLFLWVIWYCLFLDDMVLILLNDMVLMVLLVSG